MNENSLRRCAQGQRKERYHSTNNQGAVPLDESTSLEAALREIGMTVAVFLSIAVLVHLLVMAVDAASSQAPIH